jgi:hypothetical protein
MALIGVTLYFGVKTSNLRNDMKILEIKQNKAESYITYLSEEIKKLIDKGSVNVSAAPIVGAAELNSIRPQIEEQPAPEPITEQTPESIIEETSESIADEQPQIAAEAAVGGRIISAPTETDPFLSAIPTPVNAPTIANEQSYENFIGGRIFAVLAAVLIFIGMIFLAVTAFTRFGDLGKIAIMFGASTVVACAGGILTKRAKNAFTTAVTGCGLGMLLISLMAMYFYFEFLSAFAFIVLVIVWGVLVLYLSKKFDSFALTVFCHIGLTLCFCFTAFSEIGLETAFRWEFIAFECAASALMIIGGVLMSRRVTLSGLVGTGAMLLFTVIALGASSEVPALYDILYSWTADRLTAVSAYIVQLLLVTAVGFIACFVLERNEEKTDAAALIQSLFGLVFAAAFIVTLSDVSEYFRVISGAWFAFGFTAAMVIFAAVAALFPILRMKKRDENGYYTAAAWFTLSTLLIAVFIYGGSYPQSVPFEASLLLPFAFFMLLLYKIRPFLPLIIFSISAVIIDYFGMMFEGFNELSNAAKMSLPLTIGYALIYLLYAFALYKTCPKTKSDKSTIIPIRITAIILLEFCAINIIDLELRYSAEVVSAVLFTIIGTIIWCVYANLKNRNPVETVILIVNEAIILIEAFTILLEEDFIPGLLILFFATILALFRVSLIFTNESRPAETIYSCVKCAVLFLVAASFFGVETEYIFSIILILTGLLYIIGGFLLKNHTLRGAGLALSIIAVIKMAIIDVWQTDDLVRVIALITGGIICFVISAIYNKTAKKLKEDIKIEDLS